MWERENQFPIFNVIWISFTAWSTDEKKFIQQFNFFPFFNLYKSINNGQRITLFETWFDPLSNVENDQDMINFLDKAALWSSS